ncbi:hypothetical protein [Fodinibius salsisoli]|uniref:Uncharacterized protein n=1 Tax=Fodinibius salsisoli TaxID=2820877 RepID=A0ABT3PMH2_9BACT|nr:hypothetical protein [Fodinibius salsisoli]MCW9707146.1 hypothetical protein [Fodinibius salsisoli]
MGYPLVKISNSTRHVIRGKVEYASVFCSNDDYEINPGQEWEAESRGVCLLTKITARIFTDDGVIEASPYESSGTSYSQFAVVKRGEDYVVTRVVNLKDDVGDVKYDEPTEKQK